MTTLYRKYRPQTIAELDIVEARNALAQIIASGEIPHAFLFSGPKGTGKTSAARVLAKIVNCEGGGKGKKILEPCNRCEMCTSINQGVNIDVIEIDAASHRGIDDIRIVRDAVKLSPARGRKKVYIIDEAHMLTLEASNALLKTLEEPPEHVIFILATTNPEKLIETIRSRTTNINFRKATNDEVVRSLERVAKGEGKTIETNILSLVAEAAGGSFRDATKILEQLFAEGKSFKEEAVREFLFHTKDVSAVELLDLILAKDVKAALGKINTFAQKGGRITNLTEELMRLLRQSLLAKVGLGADNLTALPKDETIRLIELIAEAHRETAKSIIEELPIEIAIVKWCGNGKETEGDSPRKEEEIVNQTGQKETPTVKAVANLKGFSDEAWKQVLTNIKPVNSSIEALLRAATPLDFDGKNLTLGVFYRFHKERLEDVTHRKILEEVIAGVIGGPVRIICSLTEPPVREIREEIPAKTVLTEGEDKDIIRVAEEIFGN